MQLRDIQYVVAIAKELNFSKAAEQLFISQPALSQSIRRLEKDLNVTLFTRENNKVRLTPAGELFVEDGIKIINMSANLKTKMSNIINTKEGHLRVGISPFYSNHFLPRIIPTFRQQYPAVTLDIKEKDSYLLEEDTVNDKLDFCMTPLPVFHKELEYKVIYQEQILFAIAKNNILNEQMTPALSNGIPFIDLKLVKKEPFIFFTRMQKFTSMGMRLCSEAGFMPNIVFETTNWDTMNALIATGMGVGFVPEILVKNTNSNKNPAYYRIMAENTTRFYVGAYKKGNTLSTVAKDFISVVKKSFLQSFESSDMPSENDG